MTNSSTSEIPSTVPADERGDFVLRKYQERIDYYWKSSRYNKHGHKWSRRLTIILGALVTLISALAASDLARGDWHTLLVFSTPIIAFVLTVITGLSQSFQWGAAWREMALTALALEAERDRLRVLDADQREPAKEMEKLDGLVINEARGFFSRLTGVGDDELLIEQKAAQ